MILTDVLEFEKLIGSYNYSELYNMQNDLIELYRLRNEMMDTCERVDEIFKYGREIIILDANIQVIQMAIKYKIYTVIKKTPHGYVSLN